MTASARWARSSLADRQRLSAGACPQLTWFRDEEALGSSSVARLGSPDSLNHGTGLHRSCVAAEPPVVPTWARAGPAGYGQLREQGSQTVRSGLQSGLQFTSVQFSSRRHADRADLRREPLRSPADPLRSSFNPRLPAAGWAKLLSARLIWSRRSTASSPRTTSGGLVRGRRAYTRSHIRARHVTGGTQPCRGHQSRTSGSFTWFSRSGISWLPQLPGRGSPSRLPGPGDRRSRGRAQSGRPGYGGPG